jgi:hypothetical protein
MTSPTAPCRLLCSVKIDRFLQGLRGALLLSPRFLGLEGMGGKAAAENAAFRLSARAAWIGHKRGLAHQVG